MTVRALVKGYAAFIVIMSIVWGLLLVTKDSPEEYWYLKPKIRQGIVVSVTYSLLPLMLIDTGAEEYIEHRYPWTPPDTATLPDGFYDWRPLIDVLKYANALVGFIFIALIGMAFKREHAEK